MILERFQKKKLANIAEVLNIAPRNVDIEKNVLKMDSFARSKATYLRRHIGQS